MRAQVVIVANSFDKRDGWSTEAHHLARVLEWMNVADVRRLAVAPNGGFSPRFSFLKAVGNSFRYHKLFSGCDLIVCVCEPLIILCALQRMFRPRTKLVFIGQGTYAYFPFIRGWRNRLLRFFANRCDAFFVISHFTKTYAQQWYRKKPIQLLRLGVESTTTPPIPLANRKRSFLFVGEQKERKGVRDLLVAFASLLKEHPDAVLEFAGKPSPGYVQLAKDLGIEGSVRFLGRITDSELQTKYRTVLCHVLPAVNTATSFEGFGLVHLEANAHGTPSIGCRGTANEEVIMDGVSGFLCEQNNPNDLYAKMKSILENSQLQERLSRGAFEHALSNDWNRVLPEFWKTTLSLIPPSPGSA